MDLLPREVRHLRAPEIHQNISKHHQRFVMARFRGTLMVIVCDIHGRSCEGQPLSHSDAKWILGFFLHHSLEGQFLPGHLSCKGDRCREMISVRDLRGPPGVVAYLYLMSSPFSETYRNRRCLFHFIPSENGFVWRFVTPKSLPS